MTKALLKALFPKKYEQAAPQELVPASYPLHKNAEFIRAVMAVESGELSDIFPLRFPISGVLDKVTAQDRIGRTALHWLVARGNAKCLNMIMQRLNKEDDAIIADYDGRTVIHDAVIQNNPAVLDEILKHEMARRAIDRIGPCKRTALHWAATLGERHEILQKLIDDGANLYLTDESGQTALLLATDQGDSESKWIILVALIARGAGNEIIEELISKEQIIPIERDRNGQTFLHHAAEKGHHAIARTLVRTGSFDVNAMDIFGLTPLAYACQYGNDAVVELLIDEGANPNARGQFGVGPKPSSGETILIKATLSANVTIVNRLIGAQAEVDAKAGDGSTALWMAASKGYMDIVQALFEGGANINAKGAHESSPLGVAANGGHGPVVRLLLKLKAEVNTIDDKGRSPLSFAAGSGSKVCVDLLLDAGAVAGMKDVDGMTPSSWARRNGHEVIAKLLLEKENPHISEQTQAAGHKDETDVKIAPRSKSEDGDGWPGWLADTAGQDDSRSRWRKTNLAKSFEMTSAS